MTRMTMTAARPFNGDAPTPPPVTALAAAR